MKQAQDWLSGMLQRVNEVTETYGLVWSLKGGKNSTLALAGLIQVLYELQIGYLTFEAAMEKAQHLGQGPDLERLVSCFRPKAN